MSRTGIGVRDVLTVGALVTAVAALANNGPPDLGPVACDAGPVDRLDPRPPDRRDGETRPVGDRSGRLRGRHVSARTGTFDELTADRVTVREFAVVDDAGRERATITVDGGNVLRFRAGATGAGDRFALSVFPDGRAALLLKDDRGRNRVALAVAEDGRPFLSLDDEAAVTLKDARGVNRLVLRVDGTGEPTVLVDDRRLRDDR